MWNDNRNLIERIFKYFPDYIPNVFAAYLISVIIIIIYAFFSTKVGEFSLNTQNIVKILILSLLVAYQLLGIPYLLSNMRACTRNMKIYYKETTKFDEISNSFAAKFNDKKYVLFTLLFVILFMINDISHLDFLLFSVRNGGNVWSNLLDIFDISINYFMIILLANVIWIMLSISWFLCQIYKNANELLIKDNIFRINKFGGMKNANNFIIRSTIYYFLCISLVISYYIVPSDPRSGLEIYSGFLKINDISNILDIKSAFFVIVLYSIGLNVFFMGYRTMTTIRQILDSRIEDEISNINNLCLIHHSKLINVANDQNYSSYECEMDQVSSTLDNLYKERERLLFSYKEEYGLITLIKISIAFIIPLITLYLKT